MSVTPGSVLRVLNISLCKQRNSRLTQRSASCGIRNSIFDVDRAGRQVQEGKSAQVSRGSPLHLITGLFIFYRQIWANGGEESLLLIYKWWLVMLSGWQPSSLAHVTTINWFHHNFYLLTIRSRVSLFTRKWQFSDPDKPLTMFQNMRETTNSSEGIGPLCLQLLVIAIELLHSYIM